MTIHPALPAAVGLALCLVLAACAGRFEWRKQGEGEGAAEIARQECREEAQSYDFLDARDRSVRVMTSRGERESSIGRNAPEREADIFNDCMHSKGFELVPVTEKQK